jgi:transposase
MKEEVLPVQWLFFKPFHQTEEDYEMLYLGIDQHSKQLTIDLGSEEGDLVLHRQVSTKPAALRKFLGDLQRRCEGDGGYVAVVEVCGFNDYLIKLLREYGCLEVVLVQPEQRSKKKTDRRDARLLREKLWSGRRQLDQGKRVPGLRRVRIASDEEAANRQITALRKRLVNRRTKTINKIHGLLKKHNLQHELPTKGLQTKTARRWLEQLDLPEIDRLEMDCLLAQWTLWNEQLETVEANVDERQKKDKNALLIQTIPGLGQYSSLAISSRLGDINDFARPESLANYWGLTPRCRNSGQTERLGSITKEGSAIVRYLLGQAVLNVLRKDAWMREWYRKIKRRRGSKIARVAVMRRLATIIWSMLKHQTPYLPGGPEAIRKLRELEQRLRPKPTASQQVA